MTSVRLPSLLAAGVVVCLAFGARPVAAQDARPDSVPGLWVSAGMLVGRSVLDGNASRGWQRVGDPGPSVGGSIALEYDHRQFGGALGAEAAALKVGGRRGSSVALAATARWHPAKRLASHWAPTIELGYVRLGFGSARVTTAELPPGLFTSQALGDEAADEDLSLQGSGIRMGASIERGWKLGTNLVLGLGADAVHFSVARYEGSSRSLSKPGSGILPRILLGVRIPANPIAPLIGSGSTV